MSTERNKAVGKAFDDLGNGDGDLGRLDDLCTPDMVNHALAPGAKLGGNQHRRDQRHEGAGPPSGQADRSGPRWALAAGGDR